MKKILILSAFATGLFIAGCSEPADGDVEGAMKAAAAAPKSADELPQDMPPEARAAAAAQIARGQAMQQQANDPARVRAMQEMQKQR